MSDLIFAKLFFFAFLIDRCRDFNHPYQILLAFSALLSVHIVPSKYSKITIGGSALSVAVCIATSLLPWIGNHSYLTLFVCLAMIVGLWQGIKIVQIARPVLAVTYFWTVFHKLNLGFLDPEASCAIILPIRLFSQQAHIQSNLPSSIAWILILSTLLIESLALLRVIGLGKSKITLPIIFVFHTVLAAAGFVDFWALLAALWFAVLSEESGHTPDSLKSGYGLVYTALIYALFTFASDTWIHPDFRLRRLIAFILVAGGYVYSFGFTNRFDLAKVTERVSLSRFQTFLASLLLLWGAQPYLGIRTIGTFSMFSNLETVEGYANHLFLRHIPIFGGNARNAYHLVKSIESRSPFLVRDVRPGDLVHTFEIDRMRMQSMREAIPLQLEIEPQISHPPEPPSPIISRLKVFRSVRPSESCRW